MSVTALPTPRAMAKLPEAQTMLTEHDKMRGFAMGELKSLNRASLVRWHSQLIEDAERDEIARFPTDSGGIESLRACVSIQVWHRSGSRGKWRSVAYAKGTASPSTVALPTLRTGILLEKDRRWWQSMQVYLQLLREADQIKWHLLLQGDEYDQHATLGTAPLITPS